jgi:hypothetical protein
MMFCFRVFIAITFFTIDAMSQPVSEHHADTSGTTTVPSNSVVVNFGGGYVRINNFPRIIIFSQVEPSRLNLDLAGFSVEVHYYRKLLSSMSIGGTVAAQLAGFPAFPITIDLRFGSDMERLSPIYQVSYGYTVIPDYWEFNSTVRLLAGISWPGKGISQLLLFYQMIDIPSEQISIHALGFLFGWRWAF